MYEILQYEETDLRELASLQQPMGAICPNPTLNEHVKWLLAEKNADEEIQCTPKTQPQMLTDAPDGLFSAWCVPTK